MKYLSIKNLAEHQHYKDRNPPWIKLHRSALSNYGFRCLQDASKAHLMLLWLLASGMENRIPYDLAFITEMIGATTAVDIEELVLQGFVEVSQDDGKPLADRKQSAEPEKRRGETQHPASQRYAFMGELRPVWREAYGGEMLKGAARDLEALVTEHGLEKVVAHLRNYVKSVPAQFGTIPKFKSTFGTWDAVKASGVLPIGKEERDREQFRKRGYIS